MAKFNKKRIVAEAVASSATGGVSPSLLMKLVPRRWHMRTLFALLAALVGLGVVKLKWAGDAPGVQIDLKRTTEIEQKAERLLKAAKESLSR